jgi:hypothetical protein
MTLDEADRIPLAQSLSDTSVFEMGQIRAVIPPRVVTKADFVVLRMILDNPGRPIYFARTSGGYGHEFGFGPYLLAQGLARKLSDRMLTSGRDTLLVPGEGWVDVQRTRALWEEVFEAQDAFIKKNGWPDKASIGIPALYVSTGFMLADALEMTGDKEGVASVLERTKAVARATRIDQFFDFGEQTVDPLSNLKGDVPITSPIVPPPKRDTGRPK